MNYFDIFGIETKFLLEKEDEEKIETKFLQLHKSGTNENGVINLKATALNEGYSVLKDDTKRALYLFKLLDIDFETLKMPPDLVEYIIEIREDITDSETEKEIQEKVADVIIELEEVAIELSEHFKECFENKESKRNFEDLKLSFMRFKALDEIVKKYKKSKL